MKSDRRIRDYPQAVHLYEKGMSIQQVATFYNRTRQAMWQWLKSRGAKMRPQLKYKDDNHFFRGGIKADDHAQNMLEYAIRKGIVIPLANCEICGSHGKFKDGRSKIQAHHCDYNKPLEVMWLCQPCHHNWHKRYQAIERR